MSLTSILTFWNKFWHFKTLGSRDLVTWSNQGALVLTFWNIFWHFETPATWPAGAFDILKHFLTFWNTFWHFETLLERGLQHWMFAIFRGKYGFTRNFAIIYGFRDLSRILPNCAILRGKRQIARYRADRDKHRSLSHWPLYGWVLYLSGISLSH